MTSKTLIALAARLGLSSEIAEKMAGGGAWVFAGRLVGVPLALLVGALLARLLSPESLGAYFLAFSLAAVAGTVARMGLGKAAVRLIAESIAAGQPGRARAAVRRLSALVAAGSAAVGACLALGGADWIAREFFNSEVLAGNVAPVAIWTAVMAFQVLLADSFRGFHDIRLATLFGGLAGNLCLAILLGAVWTIDRQASLGQVLTLAIASGAGSLLLAGLMLRRRTRGLHGDGEVAAREALAIGLPVLAGTLAGTLLFTEAGTWLLAAFRSEAEVALYGVAFRLALLASVPMTIVNAVVPPMIAECHTTGRKDELEHLLRITATAAAAVAAVIWLLFALAGGVFLETVYGPYYRQAAPVLLLLALGQTINAGAGSCGLTLAMTGHQRAMMYASASTAVAGLLAILLLVGPYGATGVAAAIALSYLAQNALTATLAWKLTGLKTFLYIPLGGLGRRRIPNARIEP